MVALDQVASNFLAVAYDLADGRTTSIVFPLLTLRATQLTIGHEEAVLAGQILVNQGHAGWGKDEDGNLGLRFTHLGFATMRRMVEEPPETLPPPAVSNYTSISNSTIGGIQQGTASSQQHVEQINHLTKIEVLLVKGVLSEAPSVLDGLDLDDDARQHADEAISALADEMTDGQPDRGVVKSALGSLSQVVHGAAGSAAWTGLQILIETLA